MAIELHEEPEHKLLRVVAGGKLDRADYERFVPLVERMIQQHGPIRVLLELNDFHGWTAGALWEDVKFDLKHFRDIERLAIVGDRTWERGMATFCKPFTTASIRYFDREQRDEAAEWIRDGQES